MTARNDVTLAEAATRFCPYRAALPSPTCVGEGCMAWRFSWDASDGFEELVEETLDWRDFATDEGGGLAIVLAQFLPEPRAHEFAARLEEAEDEDEFEYIAEEIDLALVEVLAPGLDEWTEQKRPEGDGWGLRGASVEGGRRIAVFQRPAMKRGGCGLAGRIV